MECSRRRDPAFSSVRPKAKSPGSFRCTTAAPPSTPRTRPCWSQRWCASPGTPHCGTGSAPTRAGFLTSASRWRGRSMRGRRCWNEVASPELEERRLDEAVAEVARYDHQREQRQRPGAGHVEIADVHDVRVHEARRVEHDEEMQQVDRIRILT